MSFPFTPRRRGLAASLNIHLIIFNRYSRLRRYRLQGIKTKIYCKDIWSTVILFHKRNKMRIQLKKHTYCDNENSKK